jgi:hypothetical protein
MTDYCAQVVIGQLATSTTKFRMITANHLSASPKVRAGRDFLEPIASSHHLDDAIPAKPLSELPH